MVATRAETIAIYSYVQFSMCLFSDFATLLPVTKTAEKKGRNKDEDNQDKNKIKNSKTLYLN